MDITYRAARPEDLPACVDLFLESLTDLAKRHNYPEFVPPPAERMLAFYRHILATGVFHLAEADGCPAALACAIMRDHLWFLAGFWARPGLQQQHVGMPLLRSVWKAGKEAGASIFFVWASVDLPAMAAYMKMGMLPGSQILAFEGSANLPTAVPADYEVVPLRRSFAMTMNEAVLGTPRKLDHDLMQQLGWQGREVVHGGQSVGYYYLDGGNIGPAAWIEGAHAAPLLNLACREASAESATVTLRVPGMNHDALRFAFDSGLRLTGFSHLLSSAPFGCLERYLPSGPALF
jgi:hypothetical protein